MLALSTACFGFVFLEVTANCTVNLERFLTNHSSRGREVVKLRSQESLISFQFELRGACLRHASLCQVK